MSPNSTSPKRLACSHRTTPPFVFLLKSDLASFAEPNARNESAKNREGEHGPNARLVTLEKGFFSWFRSYMLISLSDKSSDNLDDRQTNCISKLRRGVKN
ncbi:hypothetical protein H9L39_19662 [Fusarium oxysporum f. sp. albedinis]|nr:hypothetical protein H9L39_19662 [Fusarium oxysporum f. sp. albedinis]